MLTHIAHTPKPDVIKLHGTRIVEVIVKKWGNSAAVRIPAAIMASAHVSLDQAVEIREEQGRIIIEPLRRKEFKLDELLGSITDKNLHQLIDTGAPVGKEVW